MKSTVIARASQTVTSMKPLIDADLAANTNPFVQFAVVNLGANDVVAGLPAEAAWEADLGYILDAIKVKWPAAKVYVMRPWRRYYAAGCNTLAGWIATVVGARAAWAFVGPDERVFLENGDNGATYTDDGVHPNAAGYSLTAAQWIAVLGY